MATQAQRPDSVPAIDGWSQAGRRIGQVLQGPGSFAVMLVHIHGIERLCAVLGHERTSGLLDQIQPRLGRVAGPNGNVERVGNRKFALVLSGLRNRGHVRLAAQKIERLVGGVAVEELDLKGLKSTIGIVLSPEHAREPRELLRLAEVAVLDARRGEESIWFYEPSSADNLFANWDVEGRLSDALDSGALELYYQPKIALDTGVVVGAEALMRWTEPELGPIAPDVFIALAESSGQILELTQFAVQRACRQLSEWQGRHPKLGVAVNITPTSIRNTEIVDVLQSVSSIWNVSPESLTLEVTENSLMENPQASHRVLTRIRDLGSRVSIDDFGTGYSSLSYLKEIPADELKIDRTFVMGMLEDAGDRKIVEHAVRIAKSFGLAVVAEGIENDEMLAQLKSMGCDYGQGYLISRPLPADEFEQFLAHGPQTG